jgi:hypothetical protein
MAKQYPEITKDILPNIKVLRQDIPDVMQGFYAMAQAATKDGALDKKTKGTDPAGHRRFHALRRLHRLSHRSAGEAGSDESGNRGNARHGDLHGRWAVADVCRRRARSL